MPSPRRCHDSRLPDRRSAILALISLLILVFPAAAQAPTEPAPPSSVQGAPDTLVPPNQRKQAPNFTLTDDHGKPVTLSALKGKVVLLDFWATWCGGCKLEIPWYIEFDRKYRAQGLAVVGVSMDDEGMKIVKPFLTTHLISYPVVIGSEALGRQFGLVTMPFTLLLDRQGKIAVAHAGVVDKHTFEDHLRVLLR